jgi:Protein of unknown function (DUF3558)
MRRISAVGTVIMSGIALAGLTACGGGKPGSPASASASAAAATPASQGKAAGPNTSLDPCSLLTTDEVAGAVGMKIDSRKADSLVAGSHDCTWTTAAGDAGAGPGEIASVTAEVAGPQPVLKAQFPTARSYYDFQRRLYNGTATDVTGIGDSAFLSHNDHWIYAVKGTVVLRVFTTFGAAGTDRAVIEKLMKDALART